MIARRRQPPTRVPPRGRRATIIRATLDSPQPLHRLADRVRAEATARGLGPATNQLKTRAAVLDLRAQGFLTKTPYGWRATPAGIALLRASETHNG